MESEMKPCPVFTAWGGGATYAPDLHMRSVRRVFNQRFAVRCECGVIGPSQITESEAIIAWNLRPTDPIIEAARKVADWWRIQWNDKSATLFGFQQHIGDTEAFKMFNALADLLKGTKDV